MDAPADGTYNRSALRRVWQRALSGDGDFRVRYASKQRLPSTNRRSTT